MKKVILISSAIVFSFVANAQSREYYPKSASVSDVVPAISAAWTSSADNSVRTLDNFKNALGFATLGAFNIDVSSSSASTLFVQCVSASLAKQTISGNVKAQMRAFVSSTSSTTISLKMIITVVNPAGAIVATLLTATSTALTTSSTNRSIPTSTALSSYSCSTGDRIVVEIGMVRSVGTTARTGSMVFGNSAGSDMPEDNTTTTALNPWIEFSNTILFNQGITQIFR